MMLADGFSRLSVVSTALTSMPLVWMEHTLNNSLIFLGTVGNYHIGIYTRLLLMFLVDPLTTPRGFLMRRWIDMTSMLKSLAPTRAFDFFTYSELIYWFCFVVLINPFRWKWALFVFMGIGRNLPAKIVGEEDRLRNGLGYKESVHRGDEKDGIGAFASVG